MDKKIIAIVIVLVFASFAAGLFVGINIFQPANAPGFSTKNSQGTFQAGWEAAKKRLAQSGLIPQAGNNPIKQVSGTVKEIKGNSVILKINPLEPLADPLLDERTIEVDNNTKIYLMVQRDAKELAKAMEEFSKKIQAQASGGTAAKSITPSDSFTKKPAKLTDIKVGTRLNVTAQAEDIKNTESFKAAEISIY